jgi:glutamate--cysteine ligase catalytic subunit
MTIICLHCLLLIGILLTDASWIRQFVTSHSDHKQDSVVSNAIQYDLIWKMMQMASGRERSSSLVQTRMQTNTSLRPNKTDSLSTILRF